MISVKGKRLVSFAFFLSIQLPENYSTLRETARYRLQSGTRVYGLCYSNSRLYVTERQRGVAQRLAAYRVDGDGLTLLDTADLQGNVWEPRVDRSTQRLYIPHSIAGGVSVVSAGDKLVRQAPITCVGRCLSVGVLSPDTLCVCDIDSECVSIVSVKNTVTGKLNKPAMVRDKQPKFIAVLGNAILTYYGDHDLILYENGVSSRGSVVPWPTGLQSPRGIFSDSVSRFLVCGGSEHSIFILDVSGKLCDKINIDTDSRVEDCTVGGGKLWVGCRNGDIIAMSPQ